MNCDIVTKQEQIFSTNDAEKVIVPSSNGQITILPQHQNLISTLQVGEVTVITKDEEFKIFIDDGILQVTSEGVSVLVNRGMPSKDVIKEEIEKAVKKAEEKINNKSTINKETLIQLERQLKFERFVRDKIK